MCKNQANVTKLGYEFMKIEDMDQKCSNFRKNHHQLQC